MKLNESQYSNSVQKYGKDLVDAIVEKDPNLSQKYLMKICEYAYKEKIPFDQIRILFSKIQTDKIVVPNINKLSYDALNKYVLQHQSQQSTLFNHPYYISNNSLIEIYLIHDYNDVKRLPFRHSWCIKDEGNFNYHAFEKSTTMYLVYNKQFSKRSNLRYVMAEVYPENSDEKEQIIYWSTNNEILNGSSLSTYLQSLGECASKIQLIPVTEAKCTNKSSKKLNKKVIYLTETNLRNIIKSSISQIFNAIKQPQDHL